jgi:SAM-dependent methyltransferase
MRPDKIGRRACCEGDTDRSPPAAALLRQPHKVARPLIAVSVRPEFSTAPRAYRPLLHAELLALQALARAGVGFGDRRPEAPVGGPANHRRNDRLGHVAAERLVPGVYAPADDLVTHMNRYLWALPRVAGRRVLDVGCGAGYGSFLMSWTGASVTGVDLDPTAVAYARAHFPGVDYREADAGDDPAGEVDVATCFEVLEHVADPDAVLAGIARHSRRLLLSFPNPLAAGSHLNPHHVNDWPLTHLKARLRAAGFRRWELFHQAPWSPVVRRGGRIWGAVWMLDASFDQRRPTSGRRAAVRFPGATPGTGRAAADRR